MNGERPPVPQVPVTTLAGTVSLTELLPELPVPIALIGDQSRSLLFHPRVAEEAQRHLNCQDPTLVAQLARALALTSADHIELKERYASASQSAIDLKSAPPLLQGILRNNPSAFAGIGQGQGQGQGIKKEVNSIPPLSNQPIVNHISDSGINSFPLRTTIKAGKDPDEDYDEALSKTSFMLNSVETKMNIDVRDKNEDMKQPFIKLVKLSNQDVKNLSDSNIKSSGSHVRNDIGNRKSRSGRDVRTKYQDEDSESDSERDGKKRPAAKYFKSREREREEKKRKDKAEKKRSRQQSDDAYDPDSELNKRLRNEEEEDECEDKEKMEGSRERRLSKKTVYNKKRIERKLVGMGENLTNEELMETGVYQRFTRSVEKIFDNTEDLDLAAEIDENGDVPQEYLIPKYELNELCSETAKLKSLKAICLVPPERLVRLLNILEKNIRDGGKVTPIVDEDDEDDDKLWLELVMERIMRGMDASLTVMYILTTKNMSKRVYLEDVIERCIQFAKFQLNNTIYPSFDPVYRTDNKRDGFVGNMRRKRAHMKDVRDRNILSLYNKLHELVSLIADLLSIQTLTDTTVLQLSSLGVAPFFVENVPELQLAALRLVTKVFAKYEKHRRLLLDDILASIARLPSSKRSLRTYRLNSDENIQMLTALVLQLIQCVVELPDELMQAGGTKNAPPTNNKDDSDKANVDRDVLVNHKYENAMGTAFSFLTVFLQKTGNKSEEIDYRPLFENFVQDLLLTVNKPEWPSAELLLSFLGKLLVQKFSNRNTDVALRVSSLDCLGIVAARLRRDAVTSRLKLDKIDRIIKDIKDEESSSAPVLEDGSAPLLENGTNSTKKNRKKKGQHKSDCFDGVLDQIPYDEEEERTIFLQRVLLDWLAVNTDSDSALNHARHFYIGQWYRDAFCEIQGQKVGAVTPRKSARKYLMQSKRKRKKKGESSEESSDPDAEDEDDEPTPLDENIKREITLLAERRKSFLLMKVTTFPPASSPVVRTQTLQTHIDYESAELITRYLASKRSFSQSFDSYLKQILRVLSESAIAVRTKAMKCLTMVVEADPAVLGRTDMQLGVHHSFLDHSTSVREAAVDLVGKFVLCRPELIYKYYDMIAARILDTGVSVRKRVIKIMKDICLEYPDFQKIPEICVKMIRRVNDEDGIKKLVQEVFQNMWFTPVRDKPYFDQDGLLLKVNNITEVVLACKDTGLDWFEQLLHSMFRPKEDKEDVTKINTEPPKTLVTACQQIVDCLVKHILVLEEKGMKEEINLTNSIQRSAVNTNITQINEQHAPRSASQRLIACLKTLFLFAKIRPKLLVEHAITLQPYLSLKCQTQGDYTVIGVVARTLELVVPLMEHPSETFLAQLEEDAVKLILLHDRTVITSCLALLGSIVNTVTKNYRLIKDCFNKYYSFITDYKRLHEEDPSNPKLGASKPYFRRSLYTVGLLLRHFNLNDAVVRCGLPSNITEHVIETITYFLNLLDIDIQFCTIQSLGSICIRHYELMMTPKIKSLYHHMLLDPEINVRLRMQTLQNIETYLQEEEIRMIKQDREWAKVKTKENLKEMCDIQSGMASAIIQIYLKQILDCLVVANLTIRHAALRVIQLVLSQGLVHPVQIVPYLVCMSTDSEELISHAADKQLQEIEKKYPGFINMKAMHGFRLSYRLQNLIQAERPMRGFKQKPGEAAGAMNGFLYSIMRGTKQQRRAVAMSLLKQFDEQARTPLPDLLFIADNLAYFPYQVADEPLFIIHHIDIMISVTGSNLLQAFRESLKPPPNVEVKYDPETGKPIYMEDEDEENDNEAVLVERLPPDMTPLIECLTASQGCLLLLMLKDHLKDVYGITDNKIWHYSPSDTSKQYEKSGGKKQLRKFQPKTTLQRLKEDVKFDPLNMTLEEKKAILEEYFAFKHLMLKIDKEEELDSDDEGKLKGQNKIDCRIPTRAQRLQLQAKKQSDVILLPGTQDGWEEKVKMEETVPDEQQRSPIKPITIKTCRLLPAPHKERHRRSSSHHKSSHKKHKKKKKRKRYSDSECDEDSEFSDPDFLV